MTARNKFIHFGCWNQKECGENANPVSMVTRAVRGTIERDESIGSLIVAGDNYYPDKEKLKDDDKKKTVVQSNLNSGFNCIDIPGVTTYMLWGNHDLDNSDKLFMEDSTNAPTCVTMYTELSNARSGLVFPDQNNIILTNKVGNTAFIMLDTTMYDITGKDKDKNLSCYYEYYGIGDLTELKEKQHGAVLEFVTNIKQDKSVTNIILIGHHPLLYVKEKKGDQKTVDLSGIYPLLFAINSKLSDVKYYYLCADYHNYQKGIVTLVDDKPMEIQQIIVGTGGTELDPALGRLQNVQLVDDAGKVIANYAIESDIHSYGFLIGTITLDAPSFEFVPVPPQGGGRPRKSRRKSRRKRSRKSRRRIK